MSALTGDGIEELIDAIGKELRSSDILIHMHLQPDQGEARSWLYQHGDVRAEEIDPETGLIHLTASLDLAEFGQFTAKFANIEIFADPSD